MIEIVESTDGGIEIVKETDVDDEGTVGVEIIVGVCMVVGVSILSLIKSIGVFCVEISDVCNSVSFLLPFLKPFLESLKSLNDICISLAFRFLFSSERRLFASRLILETVKSVLLFVSMMEKFRALSTSAAAL